MRSINIQTLKRILWVLLILNMAAIFALSAQPADLSTEETDVVISLPKHLFDRAHPELADDYDILKLFRFVVRKTAHFMEFATLSVWAGGLLILYRCPRPYVWAALFSALYALTDEFHQTFVPGRECKISDLVIDGSGAVFGALVLWLVVRQYRKANRKIIAK